MSQHQTPEISKVAVIGAGTMGAAIAQHFLINKLDVLLVDLQQRSLDQGAANIDGSLQQAVDRQILPLAKKKSILSSLKCTTDYTRLQDRALVVEAVFEDMDVKRDVFKSIETAVTDRAIIASNTSSFSISELSRTLNNRSRFLGVHYFYHAAKNKLIELIPGSDTSRQTVDELVNFYHDNGKAPIVVADMHGFAVNRFFVPWLNEAVRLHEEGIGSTAFIDQVAMDVFGITMGPFALMNATGVPITLHSARTLESHFGSMYSPAGLLVEQVERRQDWDIQTSDTDANDREQVGDRLIAMSLGIAAQMVGDGVTGITETDLAARLGLRWPTGPFELINRRGVNRTKAIVDRVFAKYGQPVPAIFGHIDQHIGFRVKHVRAHIAGRVGLVEFNRPDAMNALNPAVMQCLSDAFDELCNNPEIGTIVLFGRGKAFVAGADVKFFVDNIESGTLQDVYDFTRNGQDIFKRIADSGKRTVAYMDGLALGGGLELAMACEHRIATSRLKISFPETGIGIYPALGGAQRIARIAGKSVAKYMVATGAALNAEDALRYGLVSSVVVSTSRLDEIARLAVGDMTSAIPACDERERAFDKFDGQITDAAFDDPVLGSFEQVLRSKAPLALKKAMSLIDEGVGSTLDRALQAELDNLTGIFSTRDAYTGLSGIVNRRPVEFLGK